MAMAVDSADLERFRGEAWALGPGEIGYNTRLDVLLGEAVEVSESVRAYWEPVTAGPEPRPGLSLVAGKGVARTLHAGVAEELLALQRGTSDAHANYQLLVQRAESPVPRALLALRELHAALAFLFDDGVTDESDERLAVVSASRQEATSQPAIALALDDYANLGELHRAELAALPTFDIAHLDDARDLTEELRRRPADPSQRTAEADAAFETRERFATLLQGRLNAVRAAARYVFRDHPAIVRRFTSSHERRKRAAGRRAARKAAASEAKKAAEAAEAPATEPTAKAAKPEPAAE